MQKVVRQGEYSPGSTQADGGEALAHATEGSPADPPLRGWVLGGTKEEGGCGIVHRDWIPRDWILPQLGRRDPLELAAVAGVRRWGGVGDEEMGWGGVGWGVRRWGEVGREMLGGGGGCKPAYAQCAAYY